MLLLNMWDLQTALVSLTLLIDIFNYFAPAWQNNVGCWEL